MLHLSLVKESVNFLVTIWLCVWTTVRTALPEGENCVCLRYYSTETALLKITSDIYEAFDDHQSTLLVSLDQSTAFDCVDHTTLLGRLQHTFGITDLALDWIRSYLYSRHSFVWFSSFCCRSWSSSGLVTWTHALHTVHSTIVCCHTSVWLESSTVCWWHSDVYSCQ